MDRHQRIFGLVGAGGMGRETMSFAKRQLEAEGFTCVFVDEELAGREIFGVACISEAEFHALPARERFFNVALGDSHARNVVTERMISEGGTPFSLIHRNAFIGEEVTWEEGLLLGAFCTLTASARIGRMFQCNIYSYVAHDCVIGDFVTFAPGVHCNGNVHVDDEAYIGTGAVLRQGSSDKPLVVGRGSVVGMGAVVTKDVAPFTTVVGNPARVLVKGP